MQITRLEPQRLTSPNTKVRRLGYFTIFCSIVKNQLSFPSFSQKVLSRKDDLHLMLKEYCKSLHVRRRGNYKITGEITQEDAFQRYYHTALELGLLEALRKSVLLSKRGQILVSLPANKNPFDLSISQVHFLLRIIFEKDYDYQRALVDVVRKSYKKEGWIVFRQRIRDIWLEKEKRAASLGKVHHMNILRKSLEEIFEWKSPKRYYNENIRAPRFEWLLDLKLVDFWNVIKNRIIINPKIDLFFQNNLDIYSNTFYECFRESFKNATIDWRILGPDRKNAWIEVLLTESMNLFGPEGRLGEISANQFFEYSTSKLISEGIICNIGYLERDLITFLARGKAPYRYVKIISDVDMGYISKTV